MFVSPAFAQTAAAPGAVSGLLGAIGPLLPMIPIFYFLILRPQQKKIAAHRTMVAALKKGDQIVTQGGVFGRVTAVRDNEVEAEIAQGVRVRLVRSSITQVVTATTPVAANG